MPHELKVAGYDDLDVSSMINIPLTTVHQHKHFLGYEAARQLISEIELGEESEKSSSVKIKLEPYLVARESCGENLLH